MISFNGDYKRKDVVKLINDLIETGSNIYLYGLPSIGKTRFIQDLFKTTNYKNIRINGIECKEKGMLLKVLSQKLEREFQTKLSESAKISVFIENLTEFAENVKTNQNLDFSKENLYIMIDNFEHLQDISPKFFGSLLKLKNITNLNIYFILISSSLKENLNDMSYLHEIMIMPKILLPKMTTEEIQSILSDYLIIKYNSDIKKKNLEKLINEISKDITQNFYDILSNIITLKYIIDIIYTSIIQPLLQKNMDVTYNSLKTNKPYKVIKKFLSENPYIKLNAQELRLKIEELSLNDLEIDLYQNMQQGSVNIENIQKIPSIMLIACFIGNRNLERMDKKLFKDYKRKTRKTIKVDEEKVIVKPIKYGRLIALVQSLISIAIENFEENIYFDQSVDFYSQLNMLVEMKYLNKITKAGDEFEKIKYLCTVDFDSVLALSNKLKIRFQDFLHKKS